MPCCFNTMPDFFAERIDNGLAPLSRDDGHHALKALRLRENERVHVAVNGRRYEALLVEQGGAAFARVLRELPSNEARTALTLYQGWPKGDKMELIVRQACEIGAARIVPVLFSRSVSRPENSKRIERLRKIAREAAMQSGRTLVPEVTDIITPDELNRCLPAHELALVPYELERGRSIREACRGQADIGLIIGPEGGLTEQEVRGMPALPVTLGPRVLRTETAGVAALAMLLALNNDFLKDGQD